MKHITESQKLSHFNRLMENLGTETASIHFYGREIFEVAVNHIGLDNFFRSHMILKEYNFDDWMPILKDASRAAIFFETNIEVIRGAFTSHAINVGGLLGVEALVNKINKGDVKDAPYPADVLQDFVKKNFDSKNLSDSDQEIKDWLDKKVQWLNNSMVAQQICLAIKSGTTENYNFTMVYAALFEGKKLDPLYQAFCLGLLKTITLMIGRTFSRYLVVAERFDYARFD